MGYDVHITRAEDWAMNEGHEITAREWHELIRRDADLRLAGYNGPHFVIWNAHPLDNEAWLDLVRGNITTKAPDEPLLRKMLEIAQQLNANVQGDDGELYTGADIGAPPPNVPFHSSGPGLALIFSLAGFLGTILVIPVSAWVEKHYPTGRPRPASVAIPFTIIFGASVLALLAGGALAAGSVLSRQHRSNWGWISLLLVAGGVLILYLIQRAT